MLSLRPTRLGTVNLVGIAIFLALAALGHVMVTALRAEKEQQFRSTVIDDSTKIVARLETELNADVFLASGLVAMIAGMPNAGEEEIDGALKALYEAGHHLRNIALAPDNRITNVYPREGNEAVLDLYYPDVPEQWPSVKRAIDQRTTVLSGPVALRQGGRGLISRTPVFLGKGRYWGVFSQVIDSERLFVTAGIRDESNGIRYAIRGKDGLGEQGETFFGDPALFDGDAIIHQVNVPGGTWQLAALPSGGWHKEQGHLDLLEIFAMLAAATVALVANAYLKGRARIEASERRLRVFLDTARDGVIVIDTRGLVQEFNPAAELMFGYAAGEVLGTSVNQLMPEADALQHDRHIRQPMKQGVLTMAKGRQVHGRRKDGSEFPIEVTVGQAMVDGRRVYVGVLRDITERKTFEHKLMLLATTDSLTGVANRHAIMEALEQAFGQAQRYARPISILMIDADFFKKINDTYGHQVGDRVLVRLTEVVGDGLRTTDRLGRIGGEEFIAVLPETGPEQATQVAARLLTAVGVATVETDDGTPVRFTISIGVASSDPDCASPASAEQLIEAADQALYRAKSEGRNRYCGADDRIR